MKEKSARFIMHCDCNSFYASVEEVFNPKLRLVPMAVAGDPQARHGIILAKNEPAKKYQIKTAETIWSAKKKCPKLVLVPPRHKIYAEFCERVNAVYEQYTPLVERVGIDESFLDVTGCLHPFGGDVMKCAHEIRERVKREIEITISIGVSFNKIFAKLGSDLKKPDAVTAITRENWKEVVFPLPAGDLFFVGKKTAETLNKIGVYTIGDLAAYDKNLLIHHFGKAGEQLHLNANGLDASPVAGIGENEPIKSVGNGFTFKRDLVTKDDIQVAVTYLSDSVAARLRKHNFKCKAVQITIKDNLFITITRRTTLPAPTYLSQTIAGTAIELIMKNWRKGNPIRALTITGENLIPADRPESVQLSLFDEPISLRSERAERLEQTIDRIRERYGEHAIQHANILGNDLGIRDG